MVEKSEIRYKKLYEQQQWMYENNKRSREKRIVSIQQPYLRPIVGGNRRFVQRGASDNLYYINYLFFRLD